MDREKSIWQILSIVVAVVVLICFFFPWVEISIKILKTDLTGYQLAVGDGPAGIDIESWGILFLVPISMALAATIAILCRAGIIQTEEAARLGSIALIIAGGISVISILYQNFDMREDLNKNVIGLLAQNMISHLFGWGASLAGSLIVAIAAALDLQFSRNEKRQSMSAYGGY
jgi:hypothetical protein